MKISGLITIFGLLLFCGLKAYASSFDELYVSGSCEIELSVCPDSAGTVALLGGVKMPVGLEVRRAGAALYVSLDAGAAVLERVKLKVRYDGNLRLVSVSGRSVVNAGNIESSTQLTIVSSGSASMSTRNITAGNVNVSVTGSGAVRLEGETAASNINLSLTGSGKIVAEHLAATKLSVTQRGSGKILLGGSAHACAIVGQGSGVIEARSLVSADMKLKLFGPGHIYYPAGVRASLEGRTTNIHAVKPYQPL